MSCSCLGGVRGGVLAVSGVVASWYCWNGMDIFDETGSPVNTKLVSNLCYWVCMLTYADLISMGNFWCDFLLCISRISTSSLPSFTYASPASVPRCLGYAPCHGACFNPVLWVNWPWFWLFVQPFIMICPDICQLAGRIHMFFFCLYKSYTKIKSYKK